VRIYVDIQIFFIQITSDSDPVGVKITMVEIGEDIGVFTGSLQLCGDLSVSDGDYVYAEYGNVGDKALIESTTTSITLSTDKSVYKENEEMYVTYVISERISNEELSIRLYDPNGDNISRYDSLDLRFCLDNG